MSCRCESLKSLGHNEGKEYVKSHLNEVAVDETGWLILYKCPDSGIYWRESFPRGEEHGGGPAFFEKISREQAIREFGV